MLLKTGVVATTGIVVIVVLKKGPNVREERICVLVSVVDGISVVLVTGVTAVAEGVSPVDNGTLVGIVTIPVDNGTVVWIVTPVDNGTVVWIVTPVDNGTVVWIVTPVDNGTLVEIVTTPVESGMVISVVVLLIVSVEVTARVKVVLKLRFVMSGFNVLVVVPGVI